MSWKEALILTIAGAVLAAAGAAGGWTVQGWRKDAEIADAKRQQADSRTKAAETALSDLVDAGKKVGEAAAGLVGDKRTLTTAMAAISKDLKDAQKQKPLPVDCRPDAGRLRSLQSAVAATNNAVSGVGQQPGAAVPGVVGTGGP